jgi:hypothetical protein
MTGSNVPEDTIAVDAEATAGLAELVRCADKRGVRPIDDVDALRADFWTEVEAENQEDFDVWLQQVRREGDRPSLQE